MQELIAYVYVRWGCKLIVKEIWQSGRWMQKLLHPAGFHSLISGHSRQRRCLLNQRRKVLLSILQLQKGCQGAGGNWILQR